jgi:hypothetical protein
MASARFSADVCMVHALVSTVALNGAQPGNLSSSLPQGTCTQIIAGSGVVPCRLLGVTYQIRPCSDGCFHSGRPQRSHSVADAAQVHRRPWPPVVPSHETGYETRRSGSVSEASQDCLEMTPPQLAASAARVGSLGMNDPAQCPHGSGDVIGGHVVAHRTCPLGTPE